MAAIGEEVRAIAQEGVVKGKNAAEKGQEVAVMAQDAVVREKKAVGIVHAAEARAWEAAGKG